MGKRTKRRNKNRVSKKRVSRKKYTKRHRNTRRRIRKKKMRGGIGINEIDSRIKSILDGEKISTIEDKLKGIDYDYLFSIRFSDNLKTYLESRGVGSGYIIRFKKGLIDTFKYPYSFNTITFYPDLYYFDGIDINDKLEVVRNDSGNELAVIRVGSKIKTATHGIIDELDNPVDLTNFTELFKAVYVAAVVKKGPITLEIIEPESPAEPEPEPDKGNPF